jgi:hypothetical protein
MVLSAQNAMPWRRFIVSGSHRESMMFAACARRAAALAFGVFALLCVGVDARAQPAPDYAALIAAPSDPLDFRD